MAQALQPPETVEVEATFVSCDGGGGASGHPKVFLKLEDRRVACPYCGKVFILKTGFTLPGGH